MGITQVVVLILQIYGLSVELDKCDHNNTKTERLIANWAAWLNGISLILCGVWAALKRNSKTCTSLLEWIIKIIWIGTTLVSVLFSAISTGHMLHIDNVCGVNENGKLKIDAKTVLDTSESILVLWVVLLALGHMGAKMTKDTNTNDEPLAAVIIPSTGPGGDGLEIENGESELFFRGNKHNPIKF